MIKVALVDDHQLFRQSLSLLISTFEGFQVTYDTDDGLAFIEVAKSEHFDMVLMDIQMPKLNGYQVCTGLKSINPEIKILIISQLTSKEVVHLIMKSGANGFFTKNSPSELLEDAMKSVMEKDYYFDIQLATVIREAILWEEKSDNNLDLVSEITLSSREIEIIKMIAQEMSSKEIAETLFISNRTVEKHRIRIMKKTSSKNFIGVVLFALRADLICMSEL